MGEGAVIGPAGVVCPSQGVTGEGLFCNTVSRINTTLEVRRREEERRRKERDNNNNNNNAFYLYSAF